MCCACIQSLGDDCTHTVGFGKTLHPAPNSIFFDFETKCLFFSSVTSNHANYIWLTFLSLQVTSCLCCSQHFFGIGAFTSFFSLQNNYTLHLTGLAQAEYKLPRAGPASRLCLCGFGSWCSLLVSMATAFTWLLVTFTTPSLFSTLVSRPKGQRVAPCSSM